MNLDLVEKELLAGIDPGEVVALLQALIQQRSDYPPGNCQAAIQVIARKLEEAGIEYEILSRQDHQPNLIAKFGSEDDGASLMYHAHIDTVPAGDMESWSVDPFSGEINDGCILGRGAGDDKGSVAAQIMGLAALARVGVSPSGNLRVVIVSDEESGAHQGTKWLHDEGILTPDALVVGEQTNNQIAIAERVAIGIDLTIFGKAVHGAMPWAGENAILKTASALKWLEARLFPKWQTKEHPYLPPPTLNIGKIQGGIQWNIVPDHCKVEMDRRLLPGETRDMAMQEIREALDEFSREVEPLRYELFSTGEVAANIDTPPGDPFVLLANRTLFDLTGEERPLTGYAQTSDGRWFARDGIPIIIFGPSDPAVGHSVDEYVKIDQLVEAARFLALFAFRWLNKTPA